MKDLANTDHSAAEELESYFDSAAEGGSSVKASVLQEAEKEEKPVQEET